MRLASLSHRGTQWTQCGALWQDGHQLGADLLEGGYALRATGLSGNEHNKLLCSQGKLHLGGFAISKQITRVNIWLPSPK